MAYKTNRQTTLSVSRGNKFSVGDGVHWGFNGDRYPGTILFVSDSGRKVLVSDDKFKIVDKFGGQVEGDRLCEFTTVYLPKEECKEYTLYKDGYWRTSPGKGSAWTLQPDRCYASNPSF